MLPIYIILGFNFDAESIETEEGAVDVLHRITEAFKHGFSVRSVLGDSDSEDDIFKDRIAEVHVIT